MSRSIRSEKGKNLDLSRTEISNAIDEWILNERDSRGRYSSEGYSRDAEMVAELHRLMDDAPDERTRQEFQRFISKIESM